MVRRLRAGSGICQAVRLMVSEQCSRFRGRTPWLAAFGLILAFCQVEGLPSMSGGGAGFDHEHRGGYGFALGIFQTSSSKGKSTALRSDWWCVDAKIIGITSVARRRRWFLPLPGCQFTVSECFGPSCWVRPPPSLAAFGLVLASCQVEGLPSMSVADLRGGRVEISCIAAVAVAASGSRGRARLSAWTGSAVMLKKWSRTGKSAGSTS